MVLRLIQLRKAKSGLKAAEQKPEYKKPSGKKHTVRKIIQVWSVSLIILYNYCKANQRERLEYRVEQDQNII